MTADEARTKLCPFMIQAGGPHAIAYRCVVDRCMAWEPRRGCCLRLADPNPILQITKDGVLRHAEPADGSVG